jgi:acyl dehydratase
MDVGETYTHERTFTHEGVLQFAELTGDDQPRHTKPDEEGRLLVQGLLTGSLLTKIGGDHEVLSRRIDLHFSQPVYTGQPLTCRWTTDHLDDRGEHTYLEASVVVERPGEQAPEVVLEATVEGYI